MVKETLVVHDTLWQNADVWCLERQFGACGSVTLLSLVRMGLGPGTLPSQETKRSYRLCRAYHLVWECLSLLYETWPTLHPVL